MKTKNSCLGVIVVAVVMVASLFLGLRFFLDCGVARHKTSADRIGLERVFLALSKYREVQGRWPETIDEAVKQSGMHNLSGKTDSIIGRPWLYYPNAKPDSKEVLAAVPDVIRMDWPPFIGWQDAVLADGTFVDFRNATVPPARGNSENEIGTTKAPVKAGKE